jgi:hypothetical protein
MTNEEAIELLNRIAPMPRRGVGNSTTQLLVMEAICKAIKALGQVSHLKDRPCEACEFYTEEGCSKWECVFEGRDTE